MKKQQIIYTDGSCIPNPGPGGWAFIVLADEEDSEQTEFHISGSEKKSTNNRMELTAVIEALDFIDEHTDYLIYTDSTYVINCATGKWHRKKNIDLWERYEKVSKGKQIEWVWVKSHSGDKYNEIVDNLAKKEVKLKI